MLPTHTKQRGPSTAVKLQSAFDKGLGMAGIKATKGGSGDKERAYVVRQNWVLKTVLLLVIVFGVGLMILFSTVLKVTVQKRSAVNAEWIHHKLEKQAQVKLMRTHLELQKALEQEVHETSRVEEFRNSADQLLGDIEGKINKFLKEKGVQDDVVKQVETLEENLRSGIENRLQGLIHHFQKASLAARKRLHTVAQAIVDDVDLEKKEEDRFVEKMRKDFGVDVLQKEENKNMDDKYGLFDQPDGIEDVDDSEIAQELERFFAKLNAHNFPLLELDIIQQWENDMHDITKTLDDNEKEMDLKAVADRVNGKIAIQAPTVEKFDPAKHHSIIDYYEMRIEEAKLAYHKQSLLDLYNGWKEDGKISAYTVLSGLEHIAEQNNMYLLYEWLDGEEADQDD